MIRRPGRERVRHAAQPADGEAVHADVGPVVEQAAGAGGVGRACDGRVELRVLKHRERAGAGRKDADALAGVRLGDGLGAHLWAREGGGRRLAETRPRENGAAATETAAAAGVDSHSIHSRDLNGVAAGKPLCRNWRGGKGGRGAADKSAHVAFVALLIVAFVAPLWQKLVVLRSSQGKDGNSDSRLVDAHVQPNRMCV
eukprot:364654-Chlamydomonas_euryale.AAC.1